MNSLLNGIAGLLLDLSERCVNRDFALATRLQQIAGDLLDAARGNRLHSH